MSVFDRDNICYGQSVFVDGGLLDVGLFGKLAEEEAASVDAMAEGDGLDVNAFYLLDDLGLIEAQIMVADFESDAIAEFFDEWGNEALEVWRPDEKKGGGPVEERHC